MDLFLNDIVVKSIFSNVSVLNGSSWLSPLSVVLDINKSDWLSVIYQIKPRIKWQIFGGGVFIYSVSKQNSFINAQSHSLLSIKQFNQGVFYHSILTLRKLVCLWVISRRDSLIYSSQ